MPIRMGSVSRNARAAAVLLDKDLGKGSFGIAAQIPDDAESRLIYLSCWPEAFRKPYMKAKQNRTKAKIAAARIEHFIATRGSE